MRLTNLYRATGALGLSAAIALTGCGSDSGSSAAAPTGPTALPEAIKIAANTNNPTVVWNTLPAQWHTQADGLVHAVADAVPAPLYDNVMGTIKKLSSVLKTKKQFVLGSSFMQEALKDPDAPTKAQFDKLYDAMTAVVTAVADSDLKSVAALKKTTVARLLTEIGPTAHTSMMTIMEIAAQQGGLDGMQAKQALAMFDAFKGLKASVVSQDKTTAVISVEISGLPAELVSELPPDLNHLAVSNVDGKWVPTMMTLVWPAGIAEVQKNIAEMKSQFSADNPQSQQMQMGVQMAIGMASQLLDQLEKADSQEAFDKALASVEGLMSGMM
ncbi:MAG: hypothetical protein MK101_10610 [Phycisphaerales bacterium]|nr:hypothetical protein [Phycisphaerales bacterium]